MSEIVYPVVGDAPPCRTSVWSADGDEVCNCRTEGTAADSEARARRIAAALNATRDISTDDLEKVAALTSIDARLTVRVNNSGDAAKGE